MFATILRLPVCVAVGLSVILYFHASERPTVSVSVLLLVLALPFVRAPGRTAVRLPAQPSVRPLIRPTSCLSNNGPFVGFW